MRSYRLVPAPVHLPGRHLKVCILNITFQRTSLTCATCAPCAVIINVDDLPSTTSSIPTPSGLHPISHAPSGQAHQDPQSPQDAPVAAATVKCKPRQVAQVSARLIALYQLYRYHAED